MDILDIEDRLLITLCEAWALLPGVKHEAFITAITLNDLNAKHGSYNLDTGELRLSTRLFWGDNESQVMYLDCDGNSPPLKEPYTVRALHTALHELAHAIGATSGIDTSREWMDLSGFVEAPDDPQDTHRYWERRPGWEEGASTWRYQRGAWFPRAYSSKSPQECFADCVAHMCLGWDTLIDHANGMAKFAYLRRTMWQEIGATAMEAAAQRFIQRMQHMPSF